MDRWEFEPDDVISLVGDTFDNQEVFKAERIKITIEFIRDSD